MVDLGTVGGRLRQARKGAGLSLADVAGKAGMSISTLSRIETDKQPVEIETLILLASILSIDPASVVTAASSDGRDTIDPILSQLRVLDAGERLRLWRQLAEACREIGDRGMSRSAALTMEVEELLAQLDYLRAEIESVRDRLKK